MLRHPMANAPKTADRAPMADTTMRSVPERPPASAASSEGSGVQLVEAMMRQYTTCENCEEEGRREDLQIDLPLKILRLLLPVRVLPQVARPSISAFACTTRPLASYVHQPVDEEDAPATGFSIFSSQADRHCGSMNPEPGRGRRR
jgi:hypothetical protein